MPTLTRGVLAALTVVLVLVPSAAADTWAKISSDLGQTNLPVPALAVDGPNVVAAYSLTESPSFSGIEVSTFTSRSGQTVVGTPSLQKAVTGYSTVYWSPTLIRVPTGLAVLASGTSNIDAPPILSGDLLVPRNADGTFGAASVVGSSTSEDISSAVTLPDGSPLWAGAGGGYGLKVTHGFAPTLVVSPDLQPQLGGCCGYTPVVGRDASGRIWAAWYSNATNNTGLFIQQLDPTTLAPAGAPQLAPGSTSVENNTFKVSMACALTCRLVYGFGPPSPDTLVTWAPGDAKPVTIASTPGGDGGRVTAAAYTPSGKLWVGWYDRNANGGKGGYRATLGDATGAGGQIQDLDQPSHDPLAGSWALSAIAVGEDVLFATNFSIDKSSWIWVDRVAAASKPIPAPGPRDVDLQTTPGGKGFRIQVQYRVPVACGKPCVLRGELRTRSGRRLYSTAPLPGDGPVVLGTRAKVKVPKAGTKIRFYITVSKAELLKAPFTTSGDSRVAETRLRVWFRPNGKGAELLTIRDGRIKVSIARIKSGALPGLAGIL